VQQRINLFAIEMPQHSLRVWIHIGNSFDERHCMTRLQSMQWIGFNYHNDVLKLFELLFDGGDFFIVIKFCQYALAFSKNIVTSADPPAYVALFFQYKRESSLRIAHLAMQLDCNEYGFQFYTFARVKKSKSICMLHSLFHSAVIRQRRIGARRFFEPLGFGSDSPYFLFSASRSSRSSEHSFSRERTDDLRSKPRELCFLAF